MQTVASRKSKDKHVPPPSIRKPVVVVDVDWATIPVLEAQNLYAQLRTHVQRAGDILNARTTRGDGKWVCYMAGKPNCCPKGLVRDGLERPRFTDYSRTDANGLMVVVKICSENCSIRYNQVLIDERREKYAPKRGE
jgi:hypothetical protein